MRVAFDVAYPRLAGRRCFPDTVRIKMSIFDSSGPEDVQDIDLDTTIDSITCQARASRSRGLLRRLTPSRPHHLPGANLPQPKFAAAIAAGGSCFGNSTA